MAFSDIILTTSLRKGLEIWRRHEGALLVDVRRPEEYAAGHVAGSVNIPLDELEPEITAIAQDTDAPIFLYCRTGNRATQAAALLRDLGYENAVSIGGVEGYSGKLEQ